MSWIRTISYDEARGKLRDIYTRVISPRNYLDNILKVHSLRPHTLAAHIALYNAIVHHDDNRLPRWQREMLIIYVSVLNHCGYNVAHHLVGMRRLLQDDVRCDAIFVALVRDRPEEVFDGPELALCRYVRKLTHAPDQMSLADVEALRAAGLDDGEILEANQLAAYCCYLNRTALGLGVTTRGDRLGWHLTEDESELPGG